MNAGPTLVIMPAAQPLVLATSGPPVPGLFIGVPSAAYVPVSPALQAALAILGIQANDVDDALIGLCKNLIAREGTADSVELTADSTGVTADSE